MLNTLHSNEQKCRLVILVPLQTFRRLVFQYYRIVTRFAYAEIKEKVKKIKTLFVVRARLCHAAYQNFFPLFVSSLQGDIFHVCMRTVVLVATLLPALIKF